MDFAANYLQYGKEKALGSNESTEKIAETPAFRERKQSSRRLLKVRSSSSHFTV